MNSVSSLTFHGSCAVFHVYLIHWLMFEVGLEIVEMASFFTVWVSVFHLVMFLTLAAYDARQIFSTTKHGETSTRSLDNVLNNESFFGLFLHLAIVMSSFNQLGFWFLFYIDREMILPASVGVPPSHIHMLHSIPLFLALIAVNIFTSNFPNTKEERNCRTISQNGIKTVCLVVFVYFMFLWIVFELKGVWPYRFMFSFTRLDYFIFTLCSFLISFVLCYICSFIETKIKNFKIL